MRGTVEMDACAVSNSRSQERADVSALFPGSQLDFLLGKARLVRHSAVFALPPCAGSGAHCALRAVRARPGVYIGYEV